MLKVQIAAVALTFCIGAPLAAVDSTNQAFTVVGECVVRLLETREAERFANELSPSIQDWRSVQATNLPPTGLDPLGSEFQSGLEERRRAIANSAKQVLEMGDNYGLGSSQIHFRLKDVPPKRTGYFGLPGIQGEGLGLPWARQLKVILLGEPRDDIPANARLRGEYELAIVDALQFPAGWRSQRDIRWSRFPTNLVDVPTRQQMTLLDLAGAGRSLTLVSDPALAQLGDTLMRMLQSGDSRKFADKAMRSLDELWNDSHGQSKADDAVARREAEESWRPWREDIRSSASRVLDQAEALGLRLSKAQLELKEVVAEQPQQRGASILSLEDVQAGPVRFAVTVKSEEKSIAGKPVAGGYILRSEHARRGHGRWTIEAPIRWEEVPEGLLDEKEKREFAFENYVAEHGRLPPGSTAPDIGFTRLDGATRVDLREFRGKIALLEFWATWCGPCQAEMPVIQNLRANHPAWGDRVAVITVSVDDEPAMASQRLEKRGWTNTVNLWAGPGGIRSSPFRQLRLLGLPALCVIDRQGKVVDCDGVDETINTLLRQEGDR